jgi:hypothetical protein
MQQSTSFNLDSLDNEAMGGGGDMAIEWVEDGHWENKEVEDTTIITLSQSTQSPRQRDQRFDCQDVLYVN